MGIAKLAAMAKIPEWQAKDLQDYYFYLNPEIIKWHEQIEKDVRTKGYLTNIFGRRAWFLNKNDPMLLNKACAFKPQSGISDVMNHALVDCYENHSDLIDILMQVHDSGVFQYDIKDAERARPIIKKCMEVIVPYEKPLIIPSDFKISSVSYGDTRKIEKSVKPVDAREFRIEERNLIGRIL